MPQMGARRNRYFTKKKSKPKGKKGSKAQMRKATKKRAAY
jgi:hypothetical protein